MTVRWEVAGATDVGRVRAHNEDTFRVDTERGILIVADGMGGHAAGEVASALAAETVHSLLTRTASEEERDLKRAVRAADAAIIRHAEGDPACRGMGTTLVACALRDDGSFHLAHVGDSRAYLLHAGELAQLTRDHTWVQEQVDAGRISAARARRHSMAHVITRALGAGGENPDLLDGRLEPGDLLLLATDGLTGMVNDARLREILLGAGPLPALCESLIAAANEAGGRDNVTTVLARVLSV